MTYLELIEALSCRRCQRVRIPSNRVHCLRKRRNLLCKRLTMQGLNAIDILKMVDISTDQIDQDKLTRDLKI